MITCISDLYYKIGNWFTLGMIAIAFTVLPFALDLYDSIFTFLMCAGIGFVGVAANFRVYPDHPIHYISAGTSAACSIIWTSIVNPWALLFLLIALLGFIDKKRTLLYCEIPCFLMVFYTIIFK